MRDFGKKIYKIH